MMHTKRHHDSHKNICLLTLLFYIFSTPSGTNEVKQTILQPLNPLPSSYQSNYVPQQNPPSGRTRESPPSPRIGTLHPATIAATSKPTIIHSHKSADAAIHRALNSRICALPRTLPSATTNVMSISRISAGAGPRPRC